jgi:hypothetical protein
MMRLHTHLGLYSNIAYCALDIWWPLKKVFETSVADPVLLIYGSSMDFFSGSCAGILSCHS